MVLLLQFILATALCLVMACFRRVAGFSVEILAVLSKPQLFRAAL
jgi:hypothetical protein